MDSIEHIFAHPDDIETVLDAVEDDTLEYIPHWMIVTLTNEEFIR